MKQELRRELEKLKELGIASESLADFQVLCLPENIFNFDSIEEIADPVNAADLVKRLKETGVRSANLYQLGYRAPVISRRSDEQWLGVIWVRDKLAIPVLTGVLSALITSAIHHSSSSSAPTGAVEPANKVHVELYIENESEVIKLKYTGSGDNLIKVLSVLQQE